MKKNLLLILSAVMVMMTTGLTVAADTLVFDAVDVLNVTEEGFEIVGDRGNNEIITYDAVNAAFLPRDIPDGVPPEPCKPLVKRWNRVLTSTKPTWWRMKQFRHLLRRMGAKDCPVYIEYEDTNSTLIDATAVQPGAL